MKSKDTLPKRPCTAKEWADVIANAPGTDRPLTPAETRQWDNAVVVNGGGYQAVRAAVAAGRVARQSTAGRSPPKQLVSIRYSAEVLNYFRASGAGWQSRMDDVLRVWVDAHSSAKATSSTT